MRAFFAFATRAAQALFIMLAHCLFFTVKKHDKHFKCAFHFAFNLTYCSKEVMNIQELEYFSQGHFSTVIFFFVIDL